jgi:hypothetical protein
MKALQVAGEEEGLLVRGLRREAVAAVKRSNRLAIIS